MIKHRKISWICALVILAGTFHTDLSSARSFRQSQTIKTPDKITPSSVTSEIKGDTLDKSITLNRQIVLDAYKHIFNAWGKPEMNKMISDNFSDKKELMNAIADGVPFDAKLRFISMDSMRVLSQKKVANSKDEVASIVTAEITTEVTYQDVSLGFQTIRGTGEYTIELVTEGHNL